MRFWRLTFAALLALLAATLAAAAEKRIALVIGNDVYRNLSDKEQLINAVNDARAVKTTLVELGFEVVSGENLDRAALVERLSDFGARLQQGDIAFFFYAGHGVSLNGANYILPTDISAPRSTGRDEEERLADLAVAETRVIDRIKRSGARVAVVVLDACRDNPLASPGGRSIGGSRGLAPPPETRGVISIYSAGAGQQAMDRLNDADRNPNSVFTRVFLRKLKTPGLSVRTAAFETQGEVASLAARSGHDQVPGIYSQIIGDVYLAGPRAQAPAPGAPADTQQAEFEAAMQAGSVAALEPVQPNSTSSPNTPQPPAPHDSGQFYDPVNTVKAFYLALSSADGNSASALVVPEKQGIGPFNAANIARFYSSLREPLKILSIERLSSDFVSVKYRFTRPNGSSCRGDAKVNTIFTNGRAMIQGISANC